MKRADKWEEEIRIRKKRRRAPERKLCFIVFSLTHYPSGMLTIRHKQRQKRKRSDMRGRGRERERVLETCKCWELGWWKGEMLDINTCKEKLPP